MIEIFHIIVFLEKWIEYIFSKKIFFHCSLWQDEEGKREAKAKHPSII